MRLNDIEIIKRLTGKTPKKPIVITPMISAFEQIGASSVDVHLGTEFMVVAHSDRQYYDPLMTEEEYQKWLKHLKLVNRYSTFSDPFVLHPWQFTLASTLEFISLPSDIVGRIDGRSSWARQGLVVHSTAGDIHPGSSGFVVFELMNYGPVPILLYPGLAIAQLTFEELMGEAQESYSKRKGSKYSGFRQSLWSGYQDDSVLSVMRRLKMLRERDGGIDHGWVGAPPALARDHDLTIKHEFIGGTAVAPRQKTHRSQSVKVAIGSRPKKRRTIEFEEAMKFFRDNHSQIVAQYDGHYVAILNNQVVDYDNNWEQLSERTYGSFGKKDIYMPYVSRATDRTKVLSRPKRRTND